MESNLCLAPVPLKSQNAAPMLAKNANTMIGTLITREYRHKIGVETPFHRYVDMSEIKSNSCENQIDIIDDIYMSRQTALKDTFVNENPITSSDCSISVKYGSCCSTISSESSSKYCTHNHNTTSNNSNL